MSTPPAEPIPAASLILLRDGAAGLEVFMVRRNGGLRFAAGATVFPGGRLDPDDRAVPGPDEDAPYRFAAIREAFEECGILLACDAPGEERLATLRGPSELPFSERLRAAGIVPAIGALAPFARWVTPETVWRRFDTMFYLAPVPAGQTAAVDGGEAVEGLWGRPEAILRDADDGRLSLVFATRMNLMRLAGCATVAGTLEDAARHRPLVPILPVPVDTPAGLVFRIPPGLGYAATELPPDRVRLG